MNQELSKDTLLTAKSTTRKKDSKERDVLKLYLDAEQTAALVAELEKISGNERGINLTFHTGKKEFNGRSFDSTFFFAKATQEYGMAGGGGQQAAAPAPRKFVPKKPIG